MTPKEVADLVHLRRARDFMDRHFAMPLGVPAIAAAANMSAAHFSRKFRAAYGETPHSYLMTRRIERAKALLRQGTSVTDTCAAVGCPSLGSFSSRFAEIAGETPSQYRGRDHRDFEAVPPCLSMIATRSRRANMSDPTRRKPSRIGEAPEETGPLRCPHVSHRRLHVHSRP